MERFKCGHPKTDRNIEIYWREPSQDNRERNPQWCCRCKECRSKRHRKKRETTPRPHPRLAHRAYYWRNREKHIAYQVKYRLRMPPRRQTVADLMYHQLKRLV